MTSAAVMSAAVATALHYASQGVEGLKQGHALIVGDASAVLRCGHVRGHSDFRREDGISILTPAGAETVRRHMNMDGMTLIGTDGIVCANHIYANQLPQLGTGGSRTAASMWFSMEVPGCMVLMISQDSPGTVQKFTAGHAELVGAADGLWLQPLSQGAAAAAAAAAQAPLRTALSPGWYIVTSRTGLNCRSSHVQKTGSVARGHRFQVLEVRMGHELGNIFAAYGPERIWGRAGVARPEWLALTDNNGGMNVQLEVH